MQELPAGSATIPQFQFNKHFLKTNTRCIRMTKKHMHFEDTVSELVGKAEMQREKERCNTKPSRDSVPKKTKQSTTKQPETENKNKREKFDFGLENTRDTDLSRYFVTEFF